jgi:hypothetical protein
VLTLGLRPQHLEFYLLRPEERGACSDQRSDGRDWVIRLFVGIDLIFYGLAWIALALGLCAA